MYCAYTELMFCPAPSCDGGQSRLLPWRVLHAWDFATYRVCRAAAEYLDVMHTQPLLCVSAINAQLFNSVRALRHVRLLRLQLAYIREFVESCRQRGELIALASAMPHFLDNTETYSLADLAAIEQGALQQSLMRLVEAYARHVTRDCNVCRGRGYVCEVCADPRPVYSFEILRAVQCTGCRAFFHRACYDQRTCPK